MVGEELRDDLGSFMLFFMFFVVLAEFMSSFVLYGAYASANEFPSYSLLSYSDALSVALSQYGSHITGLFYFVNYFTNGIAHIVAAFIFVYNVFDYLYLAITWFIGLINFPFTYIPYPFNTLLTVLYYGTFGILLLFAVRIASSGMQRGRPG